MTDRRGNHPKPKGHNHEDEGDLQPLEAIRYRLRVRSILTVTLSYLPASTDQDCPHIYHSSRFLSNHTSINHEPTTHRGSELSRAQWGFADVWLQPPCRFHTLVFSSYNSSFQIAAVPAVTATPYLVIETSNRTVVTLLLVLKV